MNIIESAAKQTLSEILGFDEAKVYYSILTNNKKDIDKEFSYSKKYRILKSLFEIGAISKIKPEGKDFYSYFILPPLFLIDHNEVETYLNKLYTDNFGYQFNNNFFQIIMRTSTEKFISFLKNLNIDTENDKMNFEFTKVRCPKGHEYIGSIEVIGEESNIL